MSELDKIHYLLPHVKPTYLKDYTRDPCIDYYAAPHDDDNLLIYRYQ